MDCPYLFRRNARTNELGWTPRWEDCGGLQRTVTVWQ